MSMGEEFTTCLKNGLFNLMTYTVKEKKNYVQIEFHVIQFVTVYLSSVSGCRREESVSLLSFH